MKFKIIKLISMQAENVRNMPQIHRLKKKSVNLWLKNHLSQFSSPFCRIFDPCFVA